MAFVNKREIFEKYIEQVLRQETQYYDHRGEQYNFHCILPNCDDKKNRGFIYMDHEVPVYHCFKCETTTSIINLMKNHYSGIYLTYRREMVEAFRNDRKDSKPVSYAEIVYVNSKPVEEVVVTPVSMQDITLRNREQHEAILSKNPDMCFFKEMSRDCIEVEPFRAWCKKRNISPNHYMTWWYSTFGRFSGRVVIPFHDREGTLIYFTSRTITDQIPKYLNATSDFKPILGIDKVDVTKPLYITEGYIDSTFIPNALSLSGATSPDEIYDVIPHHNLRFFYDNDEKGREKAREILKFKRGIKVFMWKKFLIDNRITNSKIKDINDIVNLGVSLSNIEKYFTDNYNMFPMV